MAKINVSKDQILHRQGDTVDTLDLLLKGGISVRYGEDFSIQAKSGVLLGAFNPPGSKYDCDCVASEDCTIITYDYRSTDDLIAAVQSTPTIAPAIASAMVAYLNSLYGKLSAAYEDACSLVRTLKSNYSEYRNICATLMVAPQKLESIEILFEPLKPDILYGWQMDMCQAYVDQDELLRKSYYSADGAFCVGTIMLAVRTAPLIMQQIDALAAFVSRTKQDTLDFTREYRTQKAKVDEAVRQDAIGSGSSSLPSIQNAMDTILAFAGIDQATADAFRRNIDAFIKAPDKAEKSDVMIRIRREITAAFYTIYEAAFFKSLETPDIPAEVNMFFLFGFIDENLAGTDNTAELYKHALLWENDPEDKIITAYQWLLKIYRGEAIPSKNEFDQDWTDCVREDLRTNTITKKQADDLLIDTKAMVKFELNNMFKTANKMTFGSFFSFIPAFYKENVSTPLEKCLLTPAVVREAIDKIREIDYSCFYRPALASYVDMKINHFEYNVEVLPYIILMPNMGSRGVMWQEIEGRLKLTPAHMMVSIFHLPDINNTMLNLCGKFRWEMCRRIQGVHYSDIREHSLTAEYINYLQFYKKNGELSDDMKEKVKTSLARCHNSFSEVFVSEYELYIKHESNGMSRLNKIAREILFNYCTFSKKYRDALATNPKFAPLVSRWNTKRAAREHSIGFVQVKFEKAAKPVPEEILQEREYVKL
ncbi:MAG: hypothetical protein Q4D07_06995 [Selenomonadaceae bacterium]|nr:hypothetical protein [Selenomonadaceae bacterium]